MSDFKAPLDEPGMAATPTQILDVAERLFAENGIDNVSIREIVRTSGQNNLSAAHYHFGSRKALIGAMLTRRIRVINAIRHKRLDELVACGRDDSVHAIVAATVGVLGDVVKTLPWGPDYVCVVSQALFSPTLHVWSLLDDQTMSGHTRCTAMLRRLLPQLPTRVFKDRIWILNNETAYNIARWVQSNGAVTAASSRRYTSLIRNTTDFLAAGMAASVGEPDTNDAVEG
jgi:AcrR family transcriptional regulator